MTNPREELPPIMKERLAEIGEVTNEDRQRMKEIESLDSMLKDFYKGRIGDRELYENLKRFETDGKQHLLKEAYERLKSSFKWKGLRVKFEEAMDGQINVGFREEEEQVEEEKEEELVMELNDANFDKKIEENTFVVVDCWAPWCAPCRMVAPVIEELAREYKGRIAFGKLNVDRNPIIATRYRIMSIPTLLLFKDKKLVDQKVGALSKQTLQSELSKHT